MPESYVPLSILITIAVALAIAELIVPARAAARRRWPYNLALGLVGFLIGIGASAILSLSGAVWAEANGAGLFHWLGLSPLVAVPLAVVLLDLAIYWQHRWLHSVPVLWPLHRLHHRDEAMDISTGVRFHPGEILVSALYKLVVVVALGAPPLAVAIFQILLTAASFWEHANLRIPPVLDGRLRHVIVTPAMHLIHHGRDGGDMRTNYGFSTSLWDRLFASYREQPTSDRLGAE